MSRYYDAVIGRFTTKDRFMGFENSPASQNRYTYCENDPVNAVDPDGYISLKILKKYYIPYGARLYLSDKDLLNIAICLGGTAAVSRVVAYILKFIPTPQGKIGQLVAEGISVIAGSLAASIATYRHYSKGKGLRFTYKIGKGLSVAAV